MRRCTPGLAPPIALVAALLCALPAAAASVDPPRRKSGLWEIKVSTPGAAKPHVMQQCIDEKTDDLTKRDMAGVEQQACSKNELRREGEVLIADSICTFSGSTATTRSVFSGKFDSAYKVDVKSSYDPPMHGMKDSASTIEARWLGPCLPGQKPGDMVMPGMPNMPKLNLNQIMKDAQKRR